MVTVDLVLVNPAPPADVVAFVCVPVPDDLIVGLAEAALPPVAPLPVPPAVVLLPVAAPTPLAPTTPWPLNWAACDVAPTVGWPLLFLAYCCGLLPA